MKKFINLKGIVVFMSVMILGTFFIFGCSNSEVENGNQDVAGNGLNDLKVHFIDVGQADSILIQSDEKSMLIDAGNNADSELVKAYLDERNIKKIDYLIGTHPHEDHIGGLDYVINNFDIGKLYMPKITSTTKTFKDVVGAAKNKGLNFTAPKVGEIIDLGDAKCTILAPINESYEDTNDYSIVIKLDHGNNSFLFTGDAEQVVEKEMINSEVNLQSTVLKIGHHGSISSTSKEFLEKVNPKYGVITVGVDNDYGHPRQLVMDRLKEKNIEVYRTDENGTVVATSDGREIKFNTSPGSYKGLTKGKSPDSQSNSSMDNEEGNKSENKTDKVAVVYWTPNGKSYHLNKNCSGLSKSKVINSGALKDSPKTDPCDRCAI